MKIGGYLKTSVIEWPGKVAAVVFTSGCNFRCPYCHNPQLVNEERGYEDESDVSILKDLEKRKKWLDAVVITGGEPTLQPDLIDFLTRVKVLGLKVMIETNGSMPKVIARLLDCHIVDCFAIDVKAPLDENYAKTTRYKDTEIQEKIKKLLKMVDKSGIPFELRTTVVPGIHDEKTIKKIARQIKQLTMSHQPLNIKWFLQTFQPKNCLDPKFNKTKPYSLKEMEEMLKIARKTVTNTELR